MHNADKDVSRAVTAAKAICDGRMPPEDRSSILITLDHTIALILLALMDNDPKKAVAMLHERAIPHVEGRIMLYANRRG